MHLRLVFRALVSVPFGLILVLGASFGVAPAPSAAVLIQPALQQSGLTSSLYTAHLPIVVTPPQAPSVFGSEQRVYDPHPSGGLTLMATAGSSWARWNAVLWSSVEPAEGTRDWSAAADLESRLREATARGMQVILIVRSAPPWAQTPERGYCGPIRADKLPAFASFVHDLVLRYSVPPYNVKYWELWNEPDVDFSPVAPGPNLEYDCWGDRSDPYYGGGYYAEMLRAVYPKVKAADPQAQILVGGLLLGCDPMHTGADAACTGLDGDKPPRFLEGVLRNGGGYYFDGVSFHAYDFYQLPPYLGCSDGGPCQYANTAWQSASSTSGPVAIAKAHFIKSLLALYRVSDKYLINTEAAVLCDGSTCGDDYEATKAYYVTQLYAMTSAEAFRAVIWYGVFGWRNSALVSTDLTPRPAYTAYRVASAALGGARFSRQVDADPAVRGYEFMQGNRRIWVLWALDGGQHTVILPGPPLAAYDALGNTVAVASSVVVGPKPLYLEWSR